MCFLLFFPLGIPSLDVPTSILLFMSLPLAFSFDAHWSWWLLAPPRLCGLSQAAAQRCPGCWHGTGDVAPGSSLPLQFVLFPKLLLAVLVIQGGAEGAFKQLGESVSPNLVYWVFKGRCTKCHHCHHKSNCLFSKGKVVFGNGKHFWERSSVNYLKWSLEPQDASHHQKPQFPWWS